MSIYDSKLWFSDIDEVSTVVPELSALEGKTIMITGATGLICSSVVDVLIRYNETHDQPINIIAAGRNWDKVRKRFSPFCDRDYFRFVIYDALRADNKFDFYCDYIIHGASNAYPSKISKEPVETMTENFIGIKCLLDYAKNNQIKRLLYISSSEIYGGKKESRPYLENEYGYIDLLNARNSYSVGKRAAETLCASYADEYNIDFGVIRPGHIYGPTASSLDNRVSSSWAFAAMHGENIIMKSKGKQLRSYCYCLDCASAILKVLICGVKSEAYNISDSNSIISISQLAQLYAEAGHVKIIFDFPTEQDTAAFNPMKNSCLNGEKLQRLGWKSLFSPQVGVVHTVKILSELG